MAVLMNLRGTLPMTDDPPPRPPKLDPEAERRQRERDEDARQRRREKLKTDLAAAQIAEAQLVQLDIAIGDAEAKKNRIELERAEVMRPLQTRLKEIEQEQIACVKDRVDHNPALDVERGDLQSQLRLTSIEYDGLIDQQNSLLKKLEEERYAAAKAADTGGPRADLLQTASLEARVRIQVATTSTGWARRRFEAAQARHGERRDVFLTAELAMAEKLLAEVTTAEDAAVKNAIEE